MSEIALTSTQHKNKPLRKWMLALVFILAVVSLHWLLFQGREVAPGVIARPIGACDVEWFKQWGGVIVIACPHTDLIKVWPLPIQQPWYEDLIYQPETSMRTPDSLSGPTFC